MSKAPKKDIVAIGGSAGSGSVLKQLVSELSAEFPASVFISTHIPAHGPGFLTEILASSAKLPISQVVDGHP